MAPFTKRKATKAMIKRAIDQHHPFPPRMSLEIVVPEAYPLYRDYQGRKHRAYIRDADTLVVLVTAPSAYKLLEKIHHGWKYRPPHHEGLFE